MLKRKEKQIHNNHENTQKRTNERQNERMNELKKKNEGKIELYSKY